MTDWYYQRFQPGAKPKADDKKRAVERETGGFFDAQRAALGISTTKGEKDERQSFGTNWKAGK
jgi:hypothetical protein